MDKYTEKWHFTSIHARTKKYPIIISTRPLIMAGSHFYHGVCFLLTGKVQTLYETYLNNFSDIYIYIYIYI
jgi:hypothetical protein